MVCQDGDVRATITKRFDPQFHDLQAEIEILAERSFFYSAFQITIGCSDNSNIGDRIRPSAIDAGSKPVLRST